MKKYILGFVFGAVVFTGASVAFADENGGKRFNNILETIQYEIDSLRTAIANIQLTPGPQGEKGEDGVQGIQGPIGLQGAQGLKGDVGLTGLQGIQGEQGLQGHQGLAGLTGATGPQGSVGLSGTNGINGQNLVVRDARGNRVGLFLGFSPERWNGNELVPFSWNIWVDSIGASAIYSGLSGVVRPSAPRARIYYTGDSCTGYAYARSYWPGIIVVGSNSRTYIYKTGNYTNVSFKSYFRSNCETITWGEAGGYELIEVDAQLIGPLTVAKE